jgi:general secretion pathway protein E
MSHLRPTLDRLLHACDPRDAQYATQLVDELLDAAQAAGASDVHLQPTEAGLAVTWRIDGVLQPLGEVPAAARPNVVARLKVVADLLTYRSDLPQEGRIRSGRGEVEMRVSTFPTLHGERAVVRLFAPSGSGLLYLPDLALDRAVEAALTRLLSETSGAILVTGPAGSGKTTTAYACLREIVRASHGGRCVVTLEDPIETAVDGVAQAQVKPAAGFDLASGLKSLMRQDPEVILVGEVRDPETAEIALQAALTGQLVITTFHAGSAAEAIGRLLDMELEPYVVRSGLLAIVAQRLVRKLCDCCQTLAPAANGDASLGAGGDPTGPMGLPVDRYAVPVGCDACRGTGYQGRVVITEILELAAGNLARDILARRDVQTLQQHAVADGMTSIWQRACEMVATGTTSPAEVRRVLGTRGGPTAAHER